mgnify:FL=1|jgi:hypothetical protein|tara:strand:- start:247 stop:483 length:237 start_codon:yes stop_codon:yes gene_type:complete
MSEWLSWSNAAYLSVIILGAMATMVATKYRIILKEMKEAAKKYHEAAKDGKITPSEQQAIAKECMDVLMAAVKLVWRF